MVPYLLGNAKDFDAVKKMVSEQTKEDVEKIKNYRFPKNVYKKWH